jgi:hypothetical protein
MLKILKNNIDYSRKLENYLSDSVIFDLDDWLYIGYYKKFSSVYIELKNESTDDFELMAEVFNGSWTSLNLNDETNGLKRSGFLSWDKSTGWTSTDSVNGENIYFIRIKTNSTLPSLEVFGINLVFANDTDLREDYPDIYNYLPENSQSFIAYHQAARNYILTYLRNKGKTVVAQNKYKMLDQFDLHDFNEVRQAAKYLALSNIFFNESDQVDDKWYQKAVGFKHKYSEAINMKFLSIDDNDNGTQENSETQAIQFINVMRL